MKSLLLPLTLIVALTLVATALQAQTIVASSSFNATDVVINNIYDNTSVPYTNERDFRYRAGTDRDLGQTFTLSAGIQLKAITVRISDNNTNSLQAGVYNQTFTLQLYSTTDVESLSAGDYSLQTSVGFTFPDSSSVNRGDYLRMEFDTPISLLPGGYAFMLQWDTEGGSDKIVKLHHSGAVGADYTGGRGLEQNFGSGTGDVRPAFAPTSLDNASPRDLSFAITQVPEPSTFAMLGAGFGALALLRRRARRGA